MRRSPDPVKEAQRAEIERLVAEYVDAGGTIQRVDISEYKRERGRLSRAQMSKRSYLMRGYS